MQDQVDFSGSLHKEPFYNYTTSFFVTIWKIYVQVSKIDSWH